jgi:hypothetical protein
VLKINHHSNVVTSPLPKQRGNMISAVGLQVAPKLGVIRAKDGELTEGLAPRA